MNILMMANEWHKYYKESSKGALIVNAQGYDYMKDSISKEEHFDTLIIVDRDLSIDDHEKIRRLRYHVECLHHCDPLPDIYIFTSDLCLYSRHQELHNMNIRPIYTDRMVPFEWILSHQVHQKKSLKQTIPMVNQVEEQDKELIEEPKKKAKRSLSQLFKRKQEPLDTGTVNISHTMHHSVIVTGGRNTGITTTAVNMGMQFAKNSMKAIIVDLDTTMRSMNAYFDTFNQEASHSEEMEGSLIRLLANPQDYKDYACEIRKNLWVTSLGYTFADSQLEDKFLTSQYLIRMVTLLKNHFNVVIIDAPFDILKRYAEVLMHIDRIGICMENNLHALLGMIRELESSFEGQDVRYMNSKGGLIITKFDPSTQYQGSQLFGDRISEIIASGLSEFMTHKMPVMGTIPYSGVFHSQIELDQLAVTIDSSIEEQFNQIMYKVIGGN